MNRNKRYSAEVRERAVRLLLKHQGENNSQWATLYSIASKMGCIAETLRKWLRRSEIDQGKRVSIASERERMLELERENRELKRANEILRKASAFFAPAELDRRSNTSFWYCTVLTRCPDLVDHFILHNIQ